MARILAIDPGSRITGFGVVDIINGKVNYVSSGCIKLPDENLAVRLKRIFECVSEVIEEFKPNEFAIEEVFLAAIMPAIRAVLRQSPLVNLLSLDLSFCCCCFVIFIFFLKVFVLLFSTGFLFF